MSHPIELTSHHTEAQLRQRYRTASDATERAHWQVIWLKQQGQSTSQIAEATAYSAYWVRRLIHRYNEHADDGLRDLRRDHPGAAPLLDQAQQAALDHVLEHEKPADGGKWTGPKVARWIEQATQREQVHDQRGWDYLVRLGFSAQTPRPSHEQADAEAQSAFKK